MDCCTIIGILLTLYLVVQFVRILLADCDLQLQWADKFGKPIGSLARKVVWITGASSGIGEHLAYALARAGCRLVLTSRREEELHRVKKECLSFGSLLDDDILVLPLDLLNFDSYKSALGTVLERFQQVDILVNNAGRYQREVFKNTDIDVDKTLLDLNVLSVIALTKVVLPHMLDRREGHIVVTSSIAGKIGSPTSTAYAGSKHAIQGYMDSLRLEVHGDNIKVTSICPGPVVTNLLMDAATGTLDKTLQQKMEPDFTRLSACRCAHLYMVAIANQLDEVWLATQPSLLITYFGYYCPTIFAWVAKKIALKIAKKRNNQ